MQPHTKPLAPVLAILVALPLAGMAEPAPDTLGALERGLRWAERLGDPRNQEDLFLAAARVLSEPEDPADARWPLEDAFMPLARAQLRELAIGPTIVAPRATTAPSLLARELIEQTGTPVPPGAASALASLDDAHEPARSALANTLLALLEYRAASAAAFRDADPFAWFEWKAAVDAGRSAPPPPTARLGELRSSQLRLAQAGLDLRDALQTQRTAADPCGTHTPVFVAPALAISLDACNETYTTDYFYQIDAGGTDLYLNNGGGNGAFLAANCSILGRASAALLDLDGDDDYLSGRGCGINGGGYFSGSGFLLDAAGDDVYSATGSGTNGGGAWTGVGFLYDAAGTDDYFAGDSGANGGGNLGGAGSLYDAAGADDYSAGASGTNGGGSAGFGQLIDLEGGDSYSAGSSGTNGGGSLGTGLLYDGGGSDTYLAGSTSTNGGGSGGVGVLLDLSGDDTYNAGSGATNGGAGLGQGILIDADGRDTYLAGASGGTNGGGSLGSGFLWDARGDDSYTAPGNCGANGGACLGTGLLLDTGGRDVYSDNQGGTGTDRTAVKGLVGAQVDLQLLSGASAAPAALAAAPGPGPDQVTLSWAPPPGTGGSTSILYRIYRGTASARTHYAEVRDMTEFVDSAAPFGQTYYYHVTANNGVAESPPSSSANAGAYTVEGPFTTVEPFYQGRIDRVHYKVGARVRYGTGSYGTIAENVVDGPLPYTTSSYVYEVQPGPDADGDGVPASVTLRSRTTTVTDTGSIQHTPAGQTTVPLDPNDSSSSNPMPRTNGWIAFNGTANLPQYPCPNAPGTSYCTGGTFGGNFSGELQGVLPDGSAYEVVWSTNLAARPFPLGATFEYGELICVAGQASFGGGAVGRGGATAVSGQVVGRWFEPDEIPGAPHPITNLTMTFEFTWFRAGTTAVIDLTSLTIDLGVSDLPKQTVIQRPHVNNAAVATFVPQSGAGGVPTCAQPQSITGAIVGFIPLHS